MRGHRARTKPLFNLEPTLDHSRTSSIIHVRMWLWVKLTPSAANNPSYEAELSPFYTEILNDLNVTVGLVLNSYK